MCYSIIPNIFMNLNFTMVKLYRTIFCLKGYALSNCKILVLRSKNNEVSPKSPHFTMHFTLRTTCIHSVSSPYLVSTAPLVPRLHLQSRDCTSSPEIAPLIPRLHLQSRYCTSSPAIAPLVPRLHLQSRAYNILSSRMLNAMPLSNHLMGG